MLRGLTTGVSDLIAEMGPVEWAVAAAVTAVLILGIIKQAAKLALIGVALVVIGVLVLNAQSHNWQLHF